MAVFSWNTWIQDKKLSIGELKYLSNREYLFFTPKSTPVVIAEDEIQNVFSIEKQIKNKPLLEENEVDKIQKLEILVNDLYKRIKYISTGNKTIINN